VTGWTKFNNAASKVEFIIPCLLFKQTIHLTITKLIAFIGKKNSLKQFATNINTKQKGIGI